MTLNLQHTEYTRVFILSKTIVLTKNAPDWNDFPPPPSDQAEKIMNKNIVKLDCNPPIIEQALKLAKRAI